MKPEPYDSPFRWIFRSESRPGIVHLVDLCEGDNGECSCEDWMIRQQPINGQCKHIIAARDHMLNLLIQVEKKAIADAEKENQSRSRI